MQEQQLKCRHRADARLPCNVCVGGFCGVDARKCQVDVVALKWSKV
jgi:hypothetical protein